MKKVLTKTQISEKIDEFLRLKRKYYHYEKFRHGFYAIILTGDPNWTGINKRTSHMFSDRMMTLSINYSIAEINSSAIGNLIQFILTQTDDYSTNIDGDFVARICDMYEEV